MIGDNDCLTHFLETGRLGPLNLGMTRQQIIESIGEPADVGYARRRQPHDNCVLLYGETDKVNLQLALSQGRLTGIWLYFRGSDDTSSLPRWIKPVTGPLKGSMTLNEFFSFADRSELPWRIHHPLTFEDQTTLILPLGNVQLIWGRDPDSLYAAMLTE